MRHSFVAHAMIVILFGTLSICVSAPPTSDSREFLQQHCYTCHDGATAEAGLDLRELSRRSGDRSALQTWARVYDRVAAGEMPPEGEPRPAAGKADEFRKDLAAWLNATYSELYREQGRVPLRRLNPIEFENALRDLLAAPWLQLREILPPERSMYGFDNVAEVQEFSYVQMARYLEAAEVAVDSAMMLGPPQQPRTVNVDFGESRRFVNRDGWTIMLRQPNSAQAPWRISNKRQREAGWYRFTVRCKSVRYENGAILPAQRRQVAAINTAAKRFLHTFDVPEVSGEVKFVAWLNRDELLEFYCADLSDRQCPKDKDEAPRPFRGDGVAVKSIAITGPFAGPACDEQHDSWPPESYRRLFGELPTARWSESSGLLPPEKLHIPDRTANKRGVRNPFERPIESTMVVSDSPHRDAERLLRGFMVRAYRGAVSESEVQRCLKHAAAAIERRACFQDVMRVAYQAALSSPDFLYLQEAPGRLDGPLLATRLAYFLWRSPPDEEFLASVVDDDQALRRTVDEMLDDERSGRFVSDFCGQWLDLRELHETSPDRYLYPEYYGDTHLFESARAETEATFAAMLREDLPAVTAVSADFVMINERLAELYGISGVSGAEIRRVSLPSDSPRGGFLSQASVLKVTANGLTTSPVVRGAWVLDRLLGTPPAAPPPNAGSIEPDTRGATTVREQLEKHRAVASCASCHNSIDPPGFALESFDVMGGWRDRYRSTEDGEVVMRTFASKDVSFRLGPVVDASGTTSSGEAFQNYEQFRGHLVAQEEQIARNLTERLLTFATGAGITFVDRRTVDDILERARSSRWGLRSLIVEIVLSPTFRNK